VDPRGGAVAIVQRFGGALNLNIHVHALVLDGVFARAEDGRLGESATRRAADFPAVWRDPTTPRSRPRHVTPGEALAHDAVGIGGAGSVPRHDARPA
jgi:hypothetical protein